MSCHTYEQFTSHSVFILIVIVMRYWVMNIAVAIIPSGTYSQKSA